MNQDIPRIVILGAGFGGLRVALEMEKACARLRDCEILVIDKRSAHEYTPLFYEVATGMLAEHANYKTIGRLLSGSGILFNQFAAILGIKHIKFMRADVAGAVPEENKVLLANGQEIGYAHLIVALGSEINNFNITGARENALSMKSLSDAFTIRKRIHQLIDSHKSGALEKIKIAIGGAGATGTETCIELANFFYKSAKKWEIKPNSYELTLIEAGENILNGFSVNVRKAAVKRLKKYGVNVMTKTKITNVSVEDFSYISENGEQKNARVQAFVWAGGIKPSSVLAKCGFDLDEHGSIRVDETLRELRHKNIWALGDCACVAGARVPALAQVAMKQAPIVVANVIATISGNMKLHKFDTTQKWPSIIPLGGKYAVVDFYGFVFHGFLAYFLRKGADLRYFVGILPLGKALRVWWSGAHIYSKND